MYLFAVVFRELRQKAKLSIYWLMFIPLFTYGHELWVMNKKAVPDTIYCIRVTWRFLRQSKVLSHSEEVWSSADAAPHHVKPAEVAQVSCSNCLMTSLGGVFRAWACPTKQRTKTC